MAFRLVVGVGRLRPFVARLVSSDTSVGSGLKELLAEVKGLKELLPEVKALRTEMSELRFKVELLAEVKALRTEMSELHSKAVSFNAALGELRSIYGRSDAALQDIHEILNGQQMMLTAGKGDELDELDEEKLGDELDELDFQFKC